MQHLRQIRRLCSAAFVIGAAVSLGACDVVINSMDGEFGGGHFKAEKAYAKTFTLGGAASTVEIVNTNGKITVQAVDGNMVDVKATITAKGASDQAAAELLKQVEISEDVSPTLVRLATKKLAQRGRNAVEVVYTLRVPRNVQVNLQNVNGAIDITGMQASVRVETTNGNVKARGLGGSVEASTTNGGLDIQMAGLGPDGVRLDTTNGGIDLRLPADAKASLAARCINGGISVTDLPFEKDADSNRRRVDGKINGGGAPLKLETVNGGVRVRLAEAGGKESGKPEAGGKERGKVSSDLDRLHDLHGLKGLKALKGLHGHVG